MKSFKQARKEKLIKESFQYLEQMERILTMVDHSLAAKKASKAA